MKPLSLTLLVMCGLSATTTLAADEAEQQKLQGKWIVESFDFAGAPVERMVGAVRDFNGDKYTLSPKSGETYNGTIKLDASQTPKHIDLVMPDRTLKGIYEIDGPLLRIAYTLDGDNRPTELASTPDSSVVLAVHKKAP